MKRESEFLEILEKKAKEQRRLVASQILPPWAAGLGVWLAVNPWRVLAPVAGFLYVLLRAAMGVGFRDFVLGIFGGFR